MTTADEYKAEGNKYFAAKEFEKAIDSFTKAIEASPEPNHVLYSNRSGSYASLKEFGKALEDADECVKINPSWAKGYNRVGGAQFGLGNFEDAKKAYEKCLSIDPQNAQAKEGLKSIENAIKARNSSDDMGLGKLFRDPNLINKLKSNPKTSKLMEDPALVAKLLEIQANPQVNAMQLMSDQRLMTIIASLMGIDMDFTEPPSNKDEESKSTSKTEEQTKAEEQKQNVEETPKTTSASASTSASAQETKKEEPSEDKDVEMEDASSSSKAEADQAKAEGNTLYKQRKFDEAIACYDKAWDLHKDITYLNNKAAAEYEKGDYDAAIKTCNQAVDEGRDMRADYKLIAKSFARLGNTYLKKDDLPQAVKYFDKSLTEHRTPDVLNKLRSTQREIKIREAAAYINPEKAEEARLEGKQHFTNADWPAAVKAYSEMIKRAPEDARGYSNRAAALIKLLSFPDAIKDCDLAIEKDPNFIRAYIRKANAQLMMKEYTHCMETLSEARQKDLEHNNGANQHEIDQLFNKVTYQRFQNIEGETPEQTMERVSKDPEIVSILQDPVMQNILAQARDNPAALQDHMKNPDVAKKVNLLIAAGVIRTR
ncbi:Hsp90 cochaperone [Lodderomyces elongisporus]|uniref:Heat shock protein STI1 n=1 Tax=Lodderomyces elongisporus (strain ATCC 11503 / CBS 2605 / JCM 1781 / NBRC 1676 / NRRL YB-4239) TaxID=379508 RepID=A5E2C2_LODEL|nr:Hsp90 cochaperone [Lodderomyces elongisporus]EDK45580.1 heat shock protein STI1 [Lodderomyces elongisporus NRRL YB-4239]WLF80796.1 Hsp90 cochaperone [Lodderomyces elongisporus]